MQVDDDAKTPAREHPGVVLTSSRPLCSTLLSLSLPCQYVPPWPPGMHFLATDSVRLPLLQSPNTRPEQVMSAT